MTGTVTEYRESYSQPGRHWGARTISHSEHVRPLLSLGDIRELPVDDQLVFVTGYKPMRTRKLRYFADRTFMARVLPAPDQSLQLNGPGKPPIDWLRERAKGPPLPAPPTNPLFDPALVRGSAEPDEAELEHEIDGGDRDDAKGDL
jgi:type IV secretion system protein VirD4